jgi:hypothetical protein
LKGFCSLAERFGPIIATDPSHPEKTMINFPSTLRASLLASTFAFVAGCGMMPMGAKTPTAASGTTSFRASLMGASEVPAVTGAGSGSLEATLDTNTSVLRWKLTYSGLTGPATMAHFHGPAMPGTNAGVVVPFLNAMSPADGEAKLTAAQIADLMAGKWYANVHTTAHPGGEIRGQLMAR